MHLAVTAAILVGIQSTNRNDCLDRWYQTRANWLLANELKRIQGISEYRAQRAGNLGGIRGPIKVALDLRICTLSNTVSSAAHQITTVLEGRTD
jgi:hypothetical protein